jgi:hypothetical protein
VGSVTSDHAYQASRRCPIDEIDSPLTRRGCRVVLALIGIPLLGQIITHERISIWLDPFTDPAATLKRFTRPLYSGHRNAGHLTKNLVLNFCGKSSSGEVTPHAIGNFELQPGQRAYRPQRRRTNQASSFFFAVMVAFLGRPEIIRLAAAAIDLKQEEERPPCDGRSLAASRWRTSRPSAPLNEQKPGQEPGFLFGAASGLGKRSNIRSNSRFSSEGANNSEAMFIPGRKRHLDASWL